MIYLIDTNIAYYLAGISKDPSFLKEKFLNDNNNKDDEKLITSNTVMKLFFKNK